MASGGQCRHCRRLSEVSLVRCAPAERLMRTSQIIPVEERGKAALLFDAAGGWAEIDPFVLHGPPQALDNCGARWRMVRPRTDTSLRSLDAAIVLSHRYLSRPPYPIWSLPGAPGKTAIAGR